MKRYLLLAALACLGGVQAATVKFAKTAVSVKESAAYVQLTVNKTGKDAARVRFATVSGTAVPGREYYATNGILEWAEGDAKAKKISVRLMPDEVPTYEADKCFSVSLRALEEGERTEGESAAEVLTPAAEVTVTETTKPNAGKVVVAGYYDADDEWCEFDNAKKPSLIVFKNGDGGLAALSLKRTDGTDGAVKVTVTAAPSTARLGVDFTLSDDYTVTNKSTTVEWADGESGEKLVWVSTIDDEGIDGVYSRTATLKLSSAKDASHVKAALGVSSVALVVRDDYVFETLADFNKRVKNRGVSVSGSGWYVSGYGTELKSAPVAAGKKATFSVKCTGPGFFSTYGSFEASGDHDGEFTWKCGKLEDWADDDVELVLPSGSSTISFTYASPKDATADIAMIGSAFEEDLPFTWISFADVRPLPGDKAVVPAEDVAELDWVVPELAEEFEDDIGLHYRVRLSGSKTVDKNPLFETNVVSSCVTLPAGLLEADKTYYWRVDYLYGDDGSDEQMVSKGKSVWSFSTTGGKVPRVDAISAVDAYGEAVTNGFATLHQGVKVNWTLGAFGTTEAAKLKVVSGKLPKGLKLSQNARTKVWTLAGTPAEAGTFNVVIGGSVGKTTCETMPMTFVVDAIGQAAGNFSAVVVDEGQCAEMASRRMAQVAFTATDAGKLSAKVLLGGKTYSFSDTGYAECLQSEESSDEDVTADEYDDILTARLVNVTKLGKTSYTNELEVTLRDARETNLDALGKAIGSVTLRMCVPTADGKSAEVDADDRGIPFTGALYRDNTKNADVAAALANFAGYYTVALFPEPADSEDAPSGNGYLTVTVDAKGKAKVAGKLADGTSVSLTTTGGFEGLLADFWAGVPTYRLVLPVFVSKATTLLGGKLVLEWSADSASGTALFDSDEQLSWVNDSATAMYDTRSEEWSGFACLLNPAGGWYDKVCNLQSHYRRMALSAGTGEDGAREAVDLEGDKLVIASGSGTTVKLTRATGVVTGKVKLTDDYTGKTASVSHAGVLLMNYQMDSAEGLWSAGSAVISRKVGAKTVKVSCAFNIFADDIDPDFAAGDEGDWEGEPIFTEEWSD